MTWRQMWPCMELSMVAYLDLIRCSWSRFHEGSEIKQVGSGIDSLVFIALLPNFGRFISEKNDAEMGRLLKHVQASALVMPRAIGAIIIIMLHCWIEVEHSKLQIVHIWHARQNGLFVVCVQAHARQHAASISLGLIWIWPSCTSISFSRICFAEFLKTHLYQFIR